MSYEKSHTPVGLRKVDDDHVAIAWADGKECVYQMDVLRARCPCAACVDEFTGEVKVRYEDVAGVRVKKIEQVGTYAFCFTFSDGHATGFYTFRRLREWCEEDDRAASESPATSPGSSSA